MDTPQNKPPLEFWLELPGSLYVDIPRIPSSRFNLHCIEFSAYLAERTRAEKAIAALKFYANREHYKVDKLRGEIIEYDSDAGPLYNYTEHVTAREEAGAKARQTLRELGEDV